VDTDSHGVHVTWVTVIRDDDHVRYARVSPNGTAGIVDVRCVASLDATRVEVEYDLTATTDSAVPALEEFAATYDEMLAEWRELGTRALGRPAKRLADATLAAEWGTFHSHRSRLRAPNRCSE
jgi:hypothetical protein